MSEVDLWEPEPKEGEDPVDRTKRTVELRMNNLIKRFRTLYAPVTNSHLYSLTPEQFAKMIQTIEAQLAMLKALGEKRYGSASKFQL
jgi:hypothetical protein